MDVSDPNVTAILVLTYLHHNETGEERCKKVVPFKFNFHDRKQVMLLTLFRQGFAVDPQEHPLPHVRPAPLQGHPRLVFAVRFVEQVLLHLHEIRFSWKISRGDNN